MLYKIIIKNLESKNKNKISFSSNKMVRNFRVLSKLNINRIIYINDTESLGIVWNKNMQMLKYIISSISYVCESV